MSKPLPPPIRMRLATPRPPGLALDTPAQRPHSPALLPALPFPPPPPPPSTTPCSALPASRANACFARASASPLDCAPAALRSATLLPAIAWGEKDEVVRRQLRGGGRIEWRGAAQCGRGDSEWQCEVAIGRRRALAAGAGMAVGAWGSACMAGGRGEGLAEGVLGPLPDTIHASIDASRMDPHGRIIIVGDVHGCPAELEALMERCERKEGDVVILVGDMVNKGPDSHAVLRMARRIGAVAVRGNHDDKALAIAAAAAAGKSKRWRNTKWLSDLSSTDLDWLHSLPFSICIPSHNCLVVHAGLVPGIPLHRQHLTHLLNLRFIRRLPVAPIPQHTAPWEPTARGLSALLDSGSSSSSGSESESSSEGGHGWRWRMANWGAPCAGAMESGLSEWDAHDWLVSGGDGSGSESEEANGWARGWGWQACNAADEGAVLWAHEWRGRQHVVFGHDALRGLQRTPWATGLDTGCVYGGRLTACVLPSLTQLQQLTLARTAEQRREGHQGAARVWPMLQIVSVAAQRQYAMPKAKGRK
ncbi:hypothetical protein CLOM_g22152 [Closterium sp. NIES-68]|nr:hypothetical protein CLOM_g22152 [Closterium sp. NIES-68]GJP74509.1 hypothetical protein CLOP_g5076 [Closterium sp. NIES-67]